MSGVVPSVVSRETNETVFFGRHRGKPFILELVAPNIVQVRIKGTRQKESIQAGDLWRMLMMAGVSRRRMERRQSATRKKRGGV
jgi:hypothetical protein